MKKRKSFKKVKNSIYYTGSALMIIIAAFFLSLAINPDIDWDKIKQSNISAKFSLKSFSNSKLNAGIAEQAPSQQAQDEIYQFNKKIVEKQPVLLGKATTHFYGSSPARVHNIILGAKKVSDVVVQPGEIYSFLKHLGDVSEATGYKKAYVISAGSTVKEAGGGICQVSTTVFRAALDAGLPIIKRRGHGYVVSYYGPGLDATIYGPYLDFQFLNDTQYPILVKSYTTGNSVTFELWGIPDGREVYLSDVKINNVTNPPAPVFIKDYSLEVGKKWCPEKPAKGMETEVEYKVKYPDGDEKIQVFNTKYKAWGLKCYVGAMQPNSAMPNIPNTPNAQ